MLSSSGEPVSAFNDTGNSWRQSSFCLFPVFFRLFFLTKESKLPEFSVFIYKTEKVIPSFKVSCTEEKWYIKKVWHRVGAKLKIAVGSSNYTLLNQISLNLSSLMCHKKIYLCSEARKESMCVCACVCVS